MKAWGTFDNRIIKLDEMSHQHISNIFWFIHKIVPENYCESTKEEILNTIKERFEGYVLCYRPLPEFKQEREYLLHKGYLRPDNFIVVDTKIIGFYD